MKRAILCSLFTALWIVTFRSAAVSAPPGTYLLQQKYAPGTYYTVACIDTRKLNPVAAQPSSRQPAPEENQQQILIMKNVVNPPDEKGNKTVTMTYARIQQTEILAGRKTAEYDSHTPGRNAPVPETCFRPLLNAKITVILDRENHVVTLEGLENVWDDVQTTDPTAKAMIKELKQQHTNASIRKAILSYNSFLPNRPVAVGQIWSNPKFFPSIRGNFTGDLAVSFASVEQEEGREQALIVFSGKGANAGKKKNTGGNSIANQPAGTVTVKGMLRFDPAANRISEANYIMTFLLNLPFPTTGKKGNDSTTTNPVVLQTAVAMKEYFNEIPPELTAPPSTLPASVPAEAKK